MEPKDNAVCSQCGKPLVFGHFAYEPNWREFLCEDCLRELLYEIETFGIGAQL